MCDGLPSLGCRLNGTYMVDFDFFEFDDLPPFWLWFLGLVLLLVAWLVITSG